MWPDASYLSDKSWQVPPPPPPSFCSTSFKGNAISCVCKGKSSFYENPRIAGFGPCSHLCFYSLEVVFIQPGLTEHAAHFHLTGLIGTFLKWGPLYSTELMKGMVVVGFISQPSVPLHSEVLHSACWLNMMNCMTIGDGKPRDSCINPSSCVDAFAL